MAAVLAVMACRDDEHSLNPEVTVTGGTLVNAEGGSIVLKLTSTASWTAEMDQEWCTVSPAEGDAGEYDLVLTVEANGSSEGPQCGTYSVLRFCCVQYGYSPGRRCCPRCFDRVALRQQFHCAVSYWRFSQRSQNIMGTQPLDCDYIPGEEYEYDGEGSHDTVVSAYGIEEITVQSLKGVTSISLSETM